MRSDLKMVLVLALVSLISGLVLAGMHSVTAPAIAENKKEELKTAVLEVLPGAERYEEFAGVQPVTTDSSAEDGQDSGIYQGIDSNGDHSGIAFVAEGPGFQGVIKLMVGVDPDSRKLTGVKVLEQLETPGLGARIAEDWFTRQFVGKSIDDPFIPKQDVDAITGATISSRAVATIVKTEAQKVLDMVEGGERE